MEAGGGPEHSTSSVTFNLIGYTPRRNKYFHEFRGQVAAPNARRHRQGPSYTKVARNLTRSVLKNVSKRYNPNDVNSMFEILEGELRATFKSHRCGGHRRSRRTRESLATVPVGSAGGQCRWTLQKSHVIRVPENSLPPRNVAIPTTHFNIQKVYTEITCDIFGEPSTMRGSAGGLCRGCDIFGEPSTMRGSAPPRHQNSS